MIKRDCGEGEWCGLCYENAKGRSNHKGHSGYQAPRERPSARIAREIRRARPSRAVAALPVVAPPTTLRERYPTLWALLLEPPPDGSPARSQPTLLVFAEERVWKACLNDRARGRSAWVSGQSVEDVLQSLEAKLAGNAVTWRVKRPWGPQ